MGREAGDRYKKVTYDPQKISRLLVELFLDWIGKQPEEIILDFDASDIPLHGDQEGKFFHGYYDEYCYLPLFCFCARGDMENRIKGHSCPEHQSQFFSTRTSCHEFRANQLRLWLSTFAYLFYVELRSSVWTHQQPARWEPRSIRLKILKVAAKVTVSHRRIVIQLPRSFPYWQWFLQAC